MSGLSDILGEWGSNPIEVFINDKEIDSGFSRSKTAEITAVELVFRAYGTDPGFRETRYFMGYIRSERRENRIKVGETCNLDYFSKGEQIDVERGYELFLLHKVMEALAEADPRIAGREDNQDEGASGVRIIRIGGNKYDLDEMRQFYQDINEAYRRESTARKKIGQFCWPFKQENPSNAAGLRW